MTSLQHQAVSSVTRLSCSAGAPPSGTRSSVSGAARVAGARSTTPHRMNRREATCVAAARAGGARARTREWAQTESRARLQRTAA